MNKEKSTIFGEEHFIDNTMIELIETKNNVIDNMVFDEMEKSIRITLPFVKINAEKLRKWVDLCMQLENIEHSELINIATKKKILDLQSELEELKKNGIVPKFKLWQEIWYIAKKFGNTTFLGYEILKGNIFSYVSNQSTLIIANKKVPIVDNEFIFATEQEAEEALRKLEEV